MADNNGGKKQGIPNAPHEQQPQRRPNVETCRMCGRTLTDERWHHLEGCELRVCNQCFHHNKSDEKKAKRAAEAAGF